MKALMLPIVAFLVFFALGSGAGTYMTKPAIADSTLVDSTHADSTHADSTRADSSHAGPAKADTSAHGATLVPNRTEPDSATLATDPHAADPVRTPAATSSAPNGTPNTAPTGAPNTTPNSATPRPAGSRGPNSVEALVRAQTGATVTMRRDGTIGSEKPDSQPDYQRMASLLSKMGAREAARTVEQLNSTQAAHALAAMSDKQAALVLAQLQPDKAAALLQATLALIPRTVAP